MAVALAGVSGCSEGSSPGSSQTHTDTGTYNEATAEAPFTRQQELVEQGARLFVADGCTGCHSINGGSRFGPSFAHLAGSHVRLADGREVMVEEHFLDAALLDPAANAVRGYSPAPMIATVDRLKLANHREAIDALTAFIEQIGPED